MIASRDEISWTLNFRDAGNVVTVRAIPRGYKNGSEVTGDKVWVDRVLDPRFNDLWNELSATLQVAPQSPQNDASPPR